MDQGEKILEQAILLFSSEGYENVTMKDIAVAAETVPAEIYNFFVSKEAILEAIYIRYSEVIMAELPSPRTYIAVLETGSPAEILSLFNHPLPDPVYLNFCVVRIVMARKLSDARAKDVYLRHQWEKGLAFVSEVLKKGIEIGRLAMGYDEVNAFSHLIYSVREYSANMATLIPEQAVWREIETEMILHLSNSIIVNNLATYTPPANPASSASSILSEAIQCESLAVGKYSHYSSTLKQSGQPALSNLVDEIIENILDELDTLHTCANPEIGALDHSAILRRIADDERKKRLEAEKVSASAGEALSGIFVEIADLAQQHERICLSNCDEYDY